jgi:hypothetical protein
MKAMLEAAARQFGVPAEVLDLIDRNWISQLIDDFPGLLLPPIMQTLHQEYAKNGLEWVRQNVASLRNQLLLLQKLYGPTWILA